MDVATLRSLIAAGRTDLVTVLVERPGWEAELGAGQVNTLQWCVYYGDVTALRVLVGVGTRIEQFIDLDSELGNAAFFGHWKVCDFLIEHGADRTARDANGESPLS